LSREIWPLIFKKDGQIGSSSCFLVQRKLNMGCGRAGKLIEQLEAAGFGKVMFNRHNSLLQFENMRFFKNLSHFFSPLLRTDPYTGSDKIFGSTFFIFFL